MSYSPLHQSLRSYLIDEMSWDDLISLHNCYASESGDGGYVMEHCTDLVTEFGVSGEEAMRALFFGKVNNWYDRVAFNGYGNLVSVHDYTDLPNDIDTIVQWVLDECEPEFTVHLELGDMEWECDDNDTDICDKEMMARWVSDSEDYEGDRERLFDELMADGYLWFEFHKVGD